MMTRKDYVGNFQTDHASEIHRRYYSQFVTAEMKETVGVIFGLDALVESYAKCHHLNSIPLSRWDALIVSHQHLVNGDLLQAAGERYSLVSGTCIFKEAARQLVESLMN